MFIYPPRVAKLLLSSGVTSLCRRVASDQAQFGKVLFKVEEPRDGNPFLPPPRVRSAVAVTDGLEGRRERVDGCAAPRSTCTCSDHFAHL
ncbi:hypothetical protein SKAU_G00299860 [Synaphobranchus kaupii]|uniref:Uncharacterized protein n=1 Tax=Synaphobranchus kaupii TaxID=118154 RepID=A0A9Q1IN56_SYNKA|nr:hypothetical protein SKAU_G00299860 [Synaphobranchus kaupii]